MARLGKGFKIEGTLGNLCFYKTKFGYIVRSKPSISKARIKSHPAYARLRQNGAEFGRAGHATGIFRRAFRPLLQRCGDKLFSGRLTSAMLKVIHTDEVNSHGERNMMDGQPQLLEGFEFNQDAALSKIVGASSNARIDRERGEAIVEIDLSQMAYTSIPRSASHFRFFSGAAVIDFESDTYTSSTSQSQLIPVTRKTRSRLRLSQKIRDDASGHRFVLLGIEFVKIVNGEETQVSDRRLNALAVVKAVR